MTDLTRRSFLTTALAASGAAALGPAFWARAWGAAPAQPGPSPYGPLRPSADASGLLLPDGFTSRIVARANLPVPGTTYVMPIFPDGAHCFATDDGGWILVVNSEVPYLDGGGGVSAIRFSASGDIVDARRILGGTNNNCAGGATPWGTWLSCEEEADGRVWECDPTGATPARVLPGLGTFKHEAAAVDPVGRQVYLTEDETDGRFYRFTPTVWPDLAAGVLEVAEVGPGGAVTWHVVPDPIAATQPTRLQVSASTVFTGGEGCFYDAGTVYITTKGDNRVWTYTTASQTVGVLYDAAEHASPALSGVDNIIVAPTSNDVYVAEDGGNMEVVLISEEHTVSPFCRMGGPEHGTGHRIPGSPQQPVSEVTGLAFSPDGSRLYVSSQRAYVFGVTYEITGPFRSTAGAGSAAATIAAATR